MDNGESSYRRFLAGDIEGLREIINAYQYGLVLYLNSLVHNIRTAEELTADTFTELAVWRPRFSGKCTFKTWLFAIGRNLTAKYIRKYARTVNVPLESMEDLAAEEDLEQSYIQNEQKCMVHQAMRQLKPEYQQVLYLSFFEEFSNEQTARIMHKTKRQVENLLYRAKQALRSELERRGFQYDGSR